MTKTLSEALQILGEPVIFAWYVPFVLLCLKIGIRNGLARPASGTDFLIVLCWFAFDIVFLSVTVCVGIFLAQVEVAGDRANALFGVLLLGLLFSVIVGFCANEFARLMQKESDARRNSRNAIQLWFVGAYVPAVLSFLMTVGLLGQY